jgi:hypothetical protein
MMQGMALQSIEAAVVAMPAAVRPQAATPGFRVPDRAAASVRTPAGAAAPAALAGLLAVQEAEGNAARDRDARRRGAMMLDELARLQRALLGGQIDPDGLRSLAALAAGADGAADPVLAAAVRAISVRARVELARLSAAARR